MNGGRSRVLRISHAPLCYCAWRRVEIASELPRRFCAGVEHGIATTPGGQIFFASLVETISLARMNRHNPTSKSVRLPGTDGLLWRARRWHRPRR